MHKVVVIGFKPDRSSRPVRFKPLPCASLPDFLSALAELEDNSCHKNQNYPKTRLHRVTGYEKAVYRADINKISGWRLHLQFDKKTNQLRLKDLIKGQRHDDVIKVIKSKKGRYE